MAELARCFDQAACRAQPSCRALNRAPVNCADACCHCLPMAAACREEPKMAARRASARARTSTWCRSHARHALPAVTRWQSRCASKALQKATAGGRHRQAVLERWLEAKRGKRLHSRHVTSDVPQHVARSEVGTAQGAERRIEITIILCKRERMTIDSKGQRKKPQQEVVSQGRSECA
eukprot:6212336-Pleurochrysis_carterae.AAC.2